MAKNELMSSLFLSLAQTIENVKTNKFAIHFLHLLKKKVLYEVILSIFVCLQATQKPVTLIAHIILGLQ